MATINYSKALGIGSGVQGDQAGWGANDLMKIGNVAQLDPEVEKKARNLRLGFASKRSTNQALQDPTLFPQAITSLSKQLGISSQEVIKNKDSLWGILFGGK